MLPDNAAPSRARTGDDLVAVRHKNAVPAKVTPHEPRGEKHSCLLYIHLFQAHHQGVRRDVLRSDIFVFHFRIGVSQQFLEVVVELPVHVARVAQHHQGIHLGKQAAHDLKSAVDVAPRLKDGDVVVRFQCRKRHFLIGRDGALVHIGLQGREEIPLRAQDEGNLLSPMFLEVLSQHERRCAQKHNRLRGIMVLPEKELAVIFQIKRILYQQDVHVLQINVHIRFGSDVFPQGIDDCHAPWHVRRVAVDDQQIVFLRFIQPRTGKHFRRQHG
mgnify:CR=1 FL=1